MYVDIVISNVFNLNKPFFFLFFFCTFSILSMSRPMSVGTRIALHISDVDGQGICIMGG